MNASEVMRRKVWTARPEMTVRELAQLLTEHRITGAPVVDRRGTLLGVVSQTDLVRHELEPSESSDGPHDYFREPERELPEGFHAEKPDDTRVADVMTPSVVAAEEDLPLPALVRLMRRRKVHRVIITRRGELRGIVTSMDLLGVLARALERSPGA